MNKKNNDKIRSKQQREQIKAKLIEKYNISSDKAESILINLENKKNYSTKSISSSNSQHPKQYDSQKQNIGKNIKKDDKKSMNSEKNLDDLLISDIFIDENSIKTISKTNIKNDSEVFNKMDINQEKVLENLNSDEIRSKDVDVIISEIIPDYNYDISIELQNVSLTFEVVNDRIDTLKESIIRTLRHNKSKKTKFKALDDVSFKIYQGEKIGVIGYNGAGKSTLLKVITGIYPPDNGKVITKGKISPLLSLGAGFDYNYSGRKNIYLNGAVLGYDKNFLHEKEKEIIEFSELEDFIDFPIKNYSSGMLAKLGFSIATIVNPDILIIDEILSVGDVNFHKKSADKIRSLMEGGTTVLLVSHSIPQIREICDKAIWIDKGKVREIGEVNKVCDNYLEDSKKANEKQLKNIQFK